MGNEKIRSRLFNNPLFTVPRKYPRKALLLAAALSATPFVYDHYRTSGNTSVNATENSGSPSPQTADEDTCQTAEIERPIAPEVRALMPLTFNRDITVLNLPSIANDPRLSELPQVNSLIRGRRGGTARQRAEMVLAVTRRLADLQLAPTSENVHASVVEVLQARERYRNVPIFNETVIFATGAETTSPQSGQSAFMPREIVRGLERVAGRRNVHYYHGLLRERENCSWANMDSLQNARDWTLAATENAPTRITEIFSAHGGEQVIEFGILPRSETEVTNRAVFLQARELAVALAHRYENETILRQIQERPDVIIFDNCYTWRFATQSLVQELQRIGREEGRDIPLPAMIIAAEEGQVSYMGQLLRRLVVDNPQRVPTFERLYPDGDLLGHRTANSNAAVLVPDGRGGLIQIA